LSGWGRDDYSAAKQYGRQGFERYNSLNHHWGIATGLCRLGFSVLGQGRLDEAAELSHQGLERSMEYEYRSTATYALFSLGAVLATEAANKKQPPY
jgi:hypothetical protein